MFKGWFRKPFSTNHDYFHQLRKNAKSTCNGIQGVHIRVENPESNNFESFRINRNYTSSFVNSYNETKISEIFSDLFFLNFKDRAFRFRPKVDGRKPFNLKVLSQGMEVKGRKRDWMVCRIFKDDSERSFELISTILHRSGRIIKNWPCIFAMFLIFE